MEELEKLLEEAGLTPAVSSQPTATPGSAAESTPAATTSTATEDQQKQAKKKNSKKKKAPAAVSSQTSAVVEKTCMIYDMILSIYIQYNT